jgi:hypothetical protein
MEDQMAEDKIFVMTISNFIDAVIIFTHGARYMCPTKEVDGELMFWFKRKWHKVSDHTTEYTDDLRK